MKSVKVPWWGLVTSPVVIKMSTMIAYLLCQAVCSATANSKMSSRIVGGRQGDIRDWPFVAYVTALKQRAPSTSCGGSLISSQTILTAAHCLDDVPSSRSHTVKVMVGVGHRLTNKIRMYRHMKDYRTHEDYDASDEDDDDFDIAVVFLASPVQFSDTVKKVLLMTEAMGRTMAEKGGLEVAGWGIYAIGDYKRSEYLRSLRQTLIDQEECYMYINATYVNQYNHLHRKDPGIFCASKTGNIHEKEHPYRGDSGGPLARLKDQFLAGVVSIRLENYGITVYTSVPHYYSWIEKTQKELFIENCPDSARLLNGSDEG